MLRVRRTRASVVWAVVILLAAILLPSFSARVAMGASTSDELLSDAATVDLSDGEYLVDVVLDGGSGRASVDSPAKVVIREGKGIATIIWSSPHYDYMIVRGKTLLPTNTEGNSTFEIPVLAWDEPFDVVGDTTAMSQPHEIDYQLTFSLGSAKPLADMADGAGGIPLPLTLICAGAAAVAAALAWKTAKGKRTTPKN